MDSWGRVVWVFSTEAEESETQVELNLSPGIYYLRGRVDWFSFFSVAAAKAAEYYSLT
jgi:hypothetical protein